ncbi:MAG TPA: hypothetical protein VF144_14465 [Chitinophagaceae bacterium]
MKQISLLKILLLFAMSITGLLSCKKQDIDRLPGEEASSAKRPDNPGFAENDMVMYWNEKASIVMNGPFTPPEQSRYFAMVQIAVHDALNSIKPKYERFALNERAQFANPDAAVASAAYWTIKGMNIQDLHPIDTWYNESLATIPNGESKEAGKSLGKQAAEAIITNRSTDNFAQANLIFPVPDGDDPGEYRSTLPFSNPGMPKIKALQLWGTLMTGFVVPDNNQFRPTPPYAVSSSEYATEFNEVKAKGGRVGHTRTADEDEIGRFWVERSSIGWNRFARNIIATKKLDAWKTARLFALMHTAMTDGMTGCFEAKYHYFYWRPETAIRIADDGNTNTIGDATWLPGYTEGPDPDNPAFNVYTPPIPDYPSAHANFGGTASEILKLFFETDNISINQTSPTTPGVTRHYSSISKAARDNSLSRIYVGYHFRNACLKGEEQGRQIASYVFNNKFREAE